MPLKLKNASEKITIDPTKLAYLQTYFSDLIKTKPHTIIRQKYHHSDATYYNQLTLTNSELSFELIPEPKKITWSIKLSLSNCRRICKIIKLKYFYRTFTVCRHLDKKAWSTKNKANYQKITIYSQNY